MSDWSAVWESGWWTMFQTLSATAKMVICIHLFARTLSHRTHYRARLVLAICFAFGFVVMATSMGFSIFPELTDDLSFANAIITFLLALGACVLGTYFVCDAPPLPLVFCCSMAYMLENLSSAVDRAVVSTILPMGYANVVGNAVRYWVVAAIVFTLAYQLLTKRIEKKGLIHINQPIMLLVLVLVVAVNIILDLVIKDLGVLDIPQRYVVSLDFIYIGLCVYVFYSQFEILYNRRLQMDVATMSRIRADEAKQYEMSKANIDAINIKCHDIRHQIRHLQDGTSNIPVSKEVLASIAKEVDVYDSVVKSGNTALDTILTEKSLYCEKLGITLGCIADGSAVDFMKETDIYSFFGNALDNAIEAVQELNDPERRSISLDVRRRGDMTTIHVENYCRDGVRFDTNDMPITSKPDKANHGFGTRSMRQIVESYDGTLEYRASGDTFSVDALIPWPESA